MPDLNNRFSQGGYTMKFPKHIRVVVKNNRGNNVPIHLIREDQKQELSGLSPKICYKNAETGTVYFVKSQKPRKIADIFGRDSVVARALNQNFEIGQSIGVSINEYTGKISSCKNAQEMNVQQLSNATQSLSGGQEALFRKNMEIIQAGAQHVREILIERAFLETLSPQIVKALMGDSICVPENIFFITDEGEPLNLSQSLFKSAKEIKLSTDAEDPIIAFVEPLSQKSVIGEKHKPEDWAEQKAPALEDFKLTVEEGHILGQLYFVTLLIGHWDLFNNIDLSNSGYVKFSSGKILPAIADHGNDLFTGFGGLTKSENFPDNPDRHEDFKFFKKETSLKKQITGFQYTDIFDEYVSVLELPRNLISGLFNLTEKTQDPERIRFRMAQMKGFQHACKIARVKAGENLSLIKDAIPAAINKMFTQYMSAEDASLVKGIINQELYHLGGRRSENTYNLANILRGRLQSLIKIQKELSVSKVEEISCRRFRFMLDSQFQPFSTSQQREQNKKQESTTDTIVIPSEFLV
jgi:hypothetical protein